MCERKEISLKDWKLNEAEEIEELEGIYPEEINIKILKSGCVLLSIGTVLVGQIKELAFVASADATLGQIVRFHVKQFSIDTSEGGEEYVKTLHEFDGISEFIAGQKLINKVEEQLERNREGVDDDN